MWSKTFVEMVLVAASPLSCVQVIAQLQRSFDFEKYVNVCADYHVSRVSRENTTGLSANTL